MTEDQIQNLKALAEAAAPAADSWPSAIELDVEIGFRWDSAAFIAAANPQAVLGLIGQRDDLLAALRYAVHVLRHVHAQIPPPQWESIAKADAVIARAEGQP